MDADRQFARKIAEGGEADVEFFLGAIVANNFSRDSSMMLVISGVCT